MKYNGIPGALNAITATPYIVRSRRIHHAHILGRARARRVSRVLGARLVCGRPHVVNMHARTQHAAIARTKHAHCTRHVYALCVPEHTVYLARKGSGRARACGFCCSVASAHARRRVDATIKLTCYTQPTVAGALALCRGSCGISTTTTTTTCFTVRSRRVAFTFVLCCTCIVFFVCVRVLLCS